MTEEELDQYRASPSWEARVALADVNVREARAEDAYEFDPARFAAMQVPTLLLAGGDSPPEMRESWTWSTQHCPTAAYKNSQASSTLRTEQRHTCSRPRSWRSWRSQAARGAAHVPTLLHVTRSPYRFPESAPCGDSRRVGRMRWRLKEEGSKSAGTIG